MEYRGATLSTHGLGNRRSIRLSYGTGLKYQPLTTVRQFRCSQAKIFLRFDFLVLVAASTGHWPQNLIRSLPALSLHQQGLETGNLHPHVAILRWR
jgi:hypothetical protein